jgi:hypothetical protein
MSIIYKGWDLSHPKKIKCSGGIYPARKKQNVAAGFIPPEKK